MNIRCRTLDRYVTVRWTSTIHRARIAAETFTDNGSTLPRQLQVLCERADVLSKTFEPDGSQYQQLYCKQDGTPLAEHSSVQWHTSADQLLDFLGQDTEWWNLTPSATSLAMALGD